MPDICMCTGDGCTAKQECYRHCAKPSPPWQSYFMQPPGKDKSCKHFIPVTTETKNGGER